MKWKYIILLGILILLALVFLYFKSSESPQRRSSVPPQSDGTFVILDVLFEGESASPNNTIIVKIYNGYAIDVVVDKYKINVAGTLHDIPDVIVPSKATMNIILSVGADGEPWISGVTYDIYLILGE